MWALKISQDSFHCANRSAPHVCCLAGQVSLSLDSHTSTQLINYLLKNSIGLNDHDKVPVKLRVTDCKRRHQQKPVQVKNVKVSAPEFLNDAFLEKVLMVK